MLIITLSPTKSLYNYVEDATFLIFNVVGHFKVEGYILERQYLITVIILHFY